MGAIHDCVSCWHHRGGIMRQILIVLVLVLFSGCIRDDTQIEHAAKMFANIKVTAQAQQHETPPPIHQTAKAVETAAAAGLKVLGYETD